MFIRKLKNRSGGFSIQIISKSTGNYSQIEEKKSPISLVKAAELTHTIYQLNILLPESKHHEKILLQMDEDQAMLKNIIDKYY